VTGHGAANYLDHEMFEAAGVAVEYMAYSKTPWPRQGPVFTPFASILDLIANTGPAAVERLRPATVGWRAFKRQGSPNPGEAAEDGLGGGGRGE
jgi:hypothetical protein